MKNITYPLKYVKQKHHTGCGIAVVAMLCRLDYNQVLSSIDEGSKILLTEDQIRKMLSQHGLICNRGWTPCTNGELFSLETHCIIATDTHWLIYDCCEKK